MHESTTPGAEAERWLPVPDWEGLYDVSDLGRVRSYPRMTVTGMHGGGMLQAVLRGKPGYQYPHVTLARRGTKKSVPVHKLVMLAFGPPQPPGMEVCHKNGNALDPRIGNLKWGTHRENGRDMIQHGRARGAPSGEANAKAKLTADLVRQLRAEYAAGGCTERDLAQRSGVNVSTLHRMLTRQTWKNVA